MITHKVSFSIKRTDDRQTNKGYSSSSATDCSDFDENEEKNEKRDKISVQPNQCVPLRFHVRKNGSFRKPVSHSLPKNTQLTDHPANG